MITSNTTFSETSKTIEVASRNSRLSLYLSERKLLLAFVDVLVLNLALVVTVAMRPELQWLSKPFSDVLFWFISLTTIWFMWAASLDCYNLSQAASIRRSLRRVSVATVMTAAIYLMTPYVTPRLPTSRLEAVVFPMLSLMSMLAWRIIYVKVFSRPSFQQRALILGAGKGGYTLAQAVDEMHVANGNFNQTIGYRILGFIDDDPNKQGLTVVNSPVLGTCQDVVQLVQLLNPHELIVADEVIGAITSSEATPDQPCRRRTDFVHNELFAAILECREMGISITTTSMVYERLTGRVPVEQVGRALSVVLPMSQSATHRFYLLIRRIFDVWISLIGCIVLGVLIPFVWLANRFTSPGPLFYCQERVGKGGQTFSVIKFRSMIVDAEKHSGTVWASENDPRITPAGRLLRKIRLDEIPQFWNILKGDMSLIGPRPERPYFVDQLAQQFPFYRLRHAIKPGLTGWAQVRYSYGASVQDALMKLQYDLYYIKHLGILLDIEIMLKTLSVVLGLKGR